MRRDVFQGIADPNRREIINLLVNQWLPLNAVAENFPISRPAISKHIKILSECGLLEIEQRGRERYCKATLQPLTEVADWVEQSRNAWSKKLDALEVYLSRQQQKSSKTKPATRKKGK